MATLNLATLQKISTQILARDVPLYKRYLYVMPAMWAPCVKAFLFCSWAQASGACGR